MLSERHARYHFKKLVSAVEHVHSKGHSHRDLKLQNMLFTRNKELKVMDFGFGIDSKGRDSSGILTSSVGTIDNMAPEINQRGAYSGS
jgi:serine/threonine protein kinase